MVGITPPIDTSDNQADAGAAPPTRPDPSNAIIDMSIRRALSKLNLACSFHVETDIVLPVSAPAAGHMGVWYVSVLPMAGHGRLTDLRHVIWDDGVNPVVYLIAQRLMALDRDGRRQETVPMSQPRFYIWEGDQIGLLPAPDRNGSLRCVAGTGFLMPMNDNDTVDQLTSDEQVYLLCGAIVEIAVRFPYHAEWQARLQANQPMWQEGLALIQRQQMLKLREESMGLTFKQKTKSPNMQRIRS